MTELPPERRDDRNGVSELCSLAAYDRAGQYRLRLRLRGEPREQIKGRVAGILAMLGMPGLEDRRVTDLSGGQRQRVALGRALAIEPRMLLLRRAACRTLDAKVRLQLRSEIKALQSRLGFAVLHVTDDREEAMTMADRIVVMDRGQIAQVGTPEEVYHRPTSPFVATFMGADNTIGAENWRWSAGGYSGSGCITRVADQRSASAGPVTAISANEAARIEKRTRPATRSCS
jgi:ABC-type Fe3+/spermidine/putrescine transport system ATPase subunit